MAGEFRVRGVNTQVLPKSRVVASNISCVPEVLPLPSVGSTCVAR
jgi:hypothetical protein